MQFRSLFTSAAILFIFLSRLPGQTLGTSGTIQGQVLDPTGAVIANATVDLNNPITKFRKKTTTDSSGNFLSRICRRIHTT